MLKRMFMGIKNVQILILTVIEIIVIKVNIFWLKLTGSDFTIRILTVLLEHILID